MAVRLQIKAEVHMSKFIVRTIIIKAYSYVRIIKVKVQI